MLLISCWYLIAENQKNKNKINDLQDDLNKAIKRLSALEEGSQKQKGINKVYMRSYRFSDLLISKFAL